MCSNMLIESVHSILFVLANVCGTCLLVPLSGCFYPSQTSILRLRLMLFSYENSVEWNCRIRSHAGNNQVNGTTTKNIRRICRQYEMWSMSLFAFLSLRQSSCKLTTSKSSYSVSSPANTPSKTQSSPKEWRGAKLSGIGIAETKPSEFWRYCKKS